MGFIQGGILEPCVCILMLMQKSKGYLSWLEFYRTPSVLSLLLQVQRISFRNCPITELFPSLGKRFLGCKMLLYSKAIMGACASFFYVLFLYQSRASNDKTNYHHRVQRIAAHSTLWFQLSSVFYSFFTSPPIQTSGKYFG